MSTLKNFNLDGLNLTKIHAVSSYLHLFQVIYIYGIN